jgi:hypothetical protein
LTDRAKDDPIDLKRFSQLTKGDLVRGLSGSEPPLFEGFPDLSPLGGLIQTGLREVRFKKFADV